MAVIEKDLGPVSAYAMAVMHGYSGTEEEFAETIAESGNYALSAKKDAAAAEVAKKAAQEAQMGAEAAVVHPPIIMDGTWWSYDKDTQQYIDTSMPARGEPGPAGKSSYIAVTLTASGWDADAKTQTVQAAGVLSDETKQLIIPSPAQASMTSYYGAGILCTGQAEESLTFTAHTVPTEDIAVYVTLQEVTA